MLLLLTKAGFGYDNSVSLQTEDAGHVGAAVFADVACISTTEINLESLIEIG